MGATVSKRVIFAKMKKTNKPRAPLPQPSAANERSSSSDTTPTVVVAARAPLPRTWWQKAMKPAAMVLGGLACLAGAYVMFNSSSTPSRGRAIEIETGSPQASVSHTPRRYSAGAAATSGNSDRSDPVVLSDRSRPSDESFLATSYVRKRVALPNKSGDCVVIGSNSRTVGQCPQ